MNDGLADGGELVNRLGRGDGDLVEGNLEAGNVGNGDSGAVRLGNLDGDAVGGEVLEGSVVGEGGVDELVDGEAALEGARDGVLHDGQITRLFAVDVDGDGGRTLDLGTVDLDADKVLGGGLAVGAALVGGAAPLAGVGSVEGVDGGGGGLLELVGCHLPVVEVVVGVAEAVEVLDVAGGVEGGVGLEEGLQIRVGRDDGALGGSPAGAAGVVGAEHALVGLDVLPVGPETVDVGVVKHATRLSSAT